MNAAIPFLLALVIWALDTVLRPGRVTVELLAPIPTTGLGRADCESLRDQTDEAVISARKNGPPLSVKRAG